MNMRFASLTIMGLILGSPVFAADLPVNGPWPVPPVRVFTWTACYLGGMAAGGWGHKESADATAIVTGAASAPAVDPSGWLVGAQAGCDFQFAGDTVFGIEGTFAGGLIEGHSAIIPLGGTERNRHRETRCAGDSDRPCGVRNQPFVVVRQGWFCLGRRAL